LSGEERHKFVSQKLKQYQQPICFKAEFKPNNDVTATSFHLSNCIAQHGKRLSDGDFLKAAFLATSNSLSEEFPNKDNIGDRISELPVSRSTVKERILRMSLDVSHQLQMDLASAARFQFDALKY
jgi:hypothetical protein